MPEFAERHTLGQYDKRSFPIAWAVAQRTLSRHRQRRGLIDKYPALESSSFDRDGFARIVLLSVLSGAAPVAPAVFIDLHDAITAALQQNRSTMTKPMPESLGEIELELASIENRMRKRIATNHRLDARTRQLRAAADKLRYPQEPQAQTIRFKKQFTSGGKIYVYAAQRTPHGLWFATGQGHPSNGRSWRGLVDFIREDNQLARPERDLFEPLHAEALPF